MFSRRVYRWNSVDVLGDDGLLHHGLVVNKNKTGLFIDFGILTKRSALLSYDLVFRDPKEDTQKQEPLEQGDVELLYQLSSGQPWKWFPARLLSTKADPFLLVDIQTGGTHVTAVFRADRVRRRSLSRENVRRNDFVKDDVPVSAGFLATEDFCSRWKERIPNTCPVGVVGNRFSYLQSRYDKEIPLEFSTALVNMTDSEVTVLSHGIKRPFENLLADEAMDTLENGPLLMELPLEILAEAFKHLEILEQTKLRRVCTRFAAAMCSPVCNVVIISPGLRSMDAFTFASALFTILSRRVTYVIVTKYKEDFPENDIILLQKMVKTVGISVPQLILMDVVINAKFLMDSSIAALPPTLRLICARLILKNVTVSAVYGYFGRYGYEDRHIGYCAFDTGDETEFRHVFEAVCKAPDQESLGRLGKWMQALCLEGQSDESTEEMVTTVMKQWQHDDPRFGPHCTWKDVAAASLWKNFAALRKSTLWALLSTMNDFR